LDYNKYDKNANIKNVYDSSDIVQRAGGTDTGGNNNRFGLADRMINNDKVKNIQVEVPNKPSIFSIIPGTAIPSMLKDSLLGDHIDMDSKEVWEKINEK
jgi:hypothetical protein